MICPKCPLHGWSVPLAPTGPAAQWSEACFCLGRAQLRLKPEAPANAGWATQCCGPRSASGSSPSNGRTLGLQGRQCLAPQLLRARVRVGEAPSYHPLPAQVLGSLAILTTPFAPTRGHTLTAAAWLSISQKESW